MKHNLLLILLLVSSFFYGQETPTDTEIVVEENLIPTEEEFTFTELESWTATMEYGISDQRLAVVKKIRSTKNSNALTLLEESFLEEMNPVIKEEMLYTFIDFQHGDNTAFWDNLLTTESNLIVLQRTAYAIELMEIPVGDNLSLILSNYLTEPKAMRLNAATVQALGKLKHTASLPTITEIATNSTNHQDLRGAAVVALGMYQDDTLIPLLQEFLTNKTESRLIRRYAALAIGRTENPEAITILSPIATDETEEQSLRLNSISGLGYTESEEVIATLETLTKSDNTAIRTEAIKSLGRINVTSARALLEYKAKNDPEAIVRREAKNALKMFDEEDLTTTENEVAEEE